MKTKTLETPADAAGFVKGILMLLSTIVTAAIGGLRLDVILMPVVLKNNSRGGVTPQNLFQGILGMMQAMWRDGEYLKYEDALAAKTPVKHVDFPEFLRNVQKAKSVDELLVAIYKRDEQGELVKVDLTPEVRATRLQSYRRRLISMFGPVLPYTSAKIELSNKDLLEVLKETAKVLEPHVNIVKTEITVIKAGALKAKPVAKPKTAAAAAGSGTTVAPPPAA